MGSVRDWLVEGKGTDSGKYKKGEFGYWWTVEQGNDDIEGTVYKGDIDARKEGLTSLRGCPKEVHGKLKIDQNTLYTLAHAPERVTMHLSATECKLKSLEGCPAHVGSIAVDGNLLKSLQGAPETV